MSTADIIVIGGGIAGISAAAELAARADVLVLEGEAAPGYHATGRSAAVFIRNYGNAVLRVLSGLSEPVLADPGELADGPLLKPRGELMIATEAELPLLDAYAEGATGLERITGAQAGALCPLLRPGHVAAALYEPGAQDIDVDRLLQGYLRRLKARGGRVQCRAPVSAILRQSDGWRITAGGRAYSAPLIVNAAGGWADSVARMAGAVPLSLVPLRRSAVLVPLPDGIDAAAWPVVVSAPETWYAKPDAGMLMVSPADADPVEPHDAWPEDIVIAEGLDRFQQAMALEVTRVGRSWAGLRTFAPDRTPVVGHDPQVPGFFWLAGQGGYGVQTAPALAQLAAALVTGGDTAPYAGTPAALSPARFH
ncbi:glycerol-3-phosphate dehydrogenase [Meridianimarinicoccus roseus]|uniref:Glycerol-3-phosphate dehydrogenase n=1 Tax=Meridianimarinicoccus roseus TaxID=2072018 RepID=A0A2V2LC21_9RHOB|nr:FAD-binding oxidoreductase [Meridianimarinicoccus roseus]PWR02712.1 glycerol-3-phosphate dehydrogenase [Meridianimarinicoccus roseus]